MKKKETTWNRHQKLMRKIDKAIVKKMDKIIKIIKWLEYQQERKYSIIINGKLKFFTREEKEKWVNEIMSRR